MLQAGKNFKDMPIKIFHLEYIFDGETQHYYYTSLTALTEDNEGTFGLPSIYTLQRVKNWPYEKEIQYGGHTAKVIIRKELAYSTTDVRKNSKLEK